MLDSSGSFRRRSEGQSTRPVRFKTVWSTDFTLPVTADDGWRRGRDRLFLAQFRVGIDIKSVRHVGLVVGDLPRESTEDHAHENDGDGPHICQARIVGILVQYFGREVRVGTDDT